MSTLPTPASAIPAAAIPATTRPARGPIAAASLLRDIILGGQDGLVNVLGLTLGMAAATGDPRVIVTAGLAAMMAESIAMAGVAFTAGGAERDWMRSRDGALNADIEERSARELAEALERLGSDGSDGVRDALRDAVEREQGLRRLAVRRLRDDLAPVRERRPIAAAVLVGISTLLGSAIPLLPFLLVPSPWAVPMALLAGALALFVAGVARARATGSDPWRAGVSMTLIGLASAAAGYAIGVALRAPAIG